jgi:hypothetical protein
MRRVALVLTLVFATAAVAAPADAPTVLVGRSIGLVRLGMTEAALTSAYGEPAGRTQWRLGARSGPIARFRATGGTLLAYMDAGRVVAVETTSPRYRLAGAVGVGTITPHRPNEFSFSWRGFRYDACNGAYRRRAYGAITELVLPVGSMTGRRIVSVAIADGAHLLLLPGAGRCD